MIAAHPVQHATSGGWSWVAVAVVLAVALGAVLPLASRTPLRRFHAAERALVAYEADNRRRGPEWWRLSQEAAEADKAVPRWLRWARQGIRRRIDRELGQS